MHGWEDDTSHQLTQLFLEAYGPSTAHETGTNRLASGSKLDQLKTRRNLYVCKNEIIGNASSVCVTHSRAFIIVQAKTTLRAETVRPETANVEVCLRHTAMGNEQPDTEDWLRKNIEHSISDNFRVDAEDPAAVGNAPDDWVQEPDDDCVDGDGAIELA
jgi:hypothetical protein